MTSYREAGVDLDGAARHVAGIAAAVTGTWHTGVIGGFGGFAAGVELPDGYLNPILMMSTDGVGTKLEIARRFHHWDGVGYDLVAMCVDDLAAVGAKPLGFVDYLAVGSLDQRRDSSIVSSIAEACQRAGCPLLGGETAEHPGVMDKDAVDLAGAVMGVVERGSEWGPDRVSKGDVLIGLHSPNARSNGYSLIRRVMGEDIEAHITDLLAPSLIYSPSVLSAGEQGLVNSAAHITGGGIAENLHRALPHGLGLTIERSRWDPPEVFGMIAGYGVESEEMFRTFNMGIGFCLIVSPDNVDATLAAVGQHAPVLLGEVTDRDEVTIR